MALAESELGSVVCAGMCVSGVVLVVDVSAYMVGVLAVTPLDIHTRNPMSGQVPLAAKELWSKWRLLEDGCRCFIVRPGLFEWM